MLPVSYHLFSLLIAQMLPLQHTLPSPSSLQMQYLKPSPWSEHPSLTWPQLNFVLPKNWITPLSQLIKSSSWSNQPLQPTIVSFFTYWLTRINPYWEELPIVCLSRRPTKRQWLCVLSRCTGISIDPSHHHSPVNVTTSEKSKS